MSFVPSSSINMLSNDDLGNLISIYIFHTLLSIYEKNPQWFKNKYQNYPWQKDSFAQKFRAKISQKLPKCTPKSEIYDYIVTFFERIVTPQFFHSPEWFNLVANFNKLYHRLNSEIQLPQQYISILLLDIENIKLTQKIEHIFQQICEYPLLMKIAFGNWKKLGQKDLNLHERNYQLIHVPQGKNHADLKIIEIGKFLINQNTNIKEVFVVSSDTDLDNFCDFLVAQKITLYRVIRKVDSLTILNSKTGQTHDYALNMINNIPDLPDFINQVKEIIKQESILTGRNWLKISRLHQLFNLKYQQNLNKILASHFPNQSNPWLLMKYDFSIHNLDQENHVYLSVFDGKFSQKIKHIAENKFLNNIKNKAKKINNLEDLEQAIYQIITNLISQSQQDFTTLSKVATKFNTHYQISLTKIMQEFKLTQKLPKLIDSYPKLIINKVKNNYHITLKKN